MLTNDIKNGMRIKLKNGWFGTMMDNARGNTRMVEVEGYEREIGSVYSWDIESVVPTKGPSAGIWVNVDLTPDQIKFRKEVESFYNHAS